MQEHDDVGVLLDSAGVAQVRQNRTLIASLCAGTGELRQSHQRNIQLLGDALEVAGDFADLVLPVFHMPVRAHQLQVVHHDEIKPVFHLEAAASGAQLRRRNAGRIVDIDVRRGKRTQCRGERHPVVIPQRAVANRLHIHPRISAQQTHGKLILRHFQRKDRRRLARHRRGMTDDVHAEAGFTHRRTRADDDQFAAVQTRQQIVQIDKARRHAVDAAL